MAIPKPLFIHYGFMDGACGSCIFDISGTTYLVVGTVSGICKLYSTSTHLPIINVYEDQEHRSVISVGQIRPNYLFLHVRSHAVLLLKFSVESGELTFEIEKSVSTKHYGFCRTISQSENVYVPLYNDSVNAVIIVDKFYNEREMQISFKDEKQPGMLMSLTIMDLSVNVNEGQFLICCFEDGTIRAFSESIFASSIFRNFIAVGSVKNVIKFYSFESSSLVDGNVILFPAEAGGCASLCFSPCGKFLASGYWDGSIRVHSVKSSKIRVSIDFHKATINYLDWQKVEGRRLLYASCKDGSLSIWNLLSD